MPDSIRDPRGIDLDATHLKGDLRDRDHFTWSHHQGSAKIRDVIRPVGDYDWITVSVEKRSDSMRERHGLISKVEHRDPVRHTPKMRLNLFRNKALELRPRRQDRVERVL